ncbi:phage tail protein [Ferrimonas pelagia]|uniref:Prophage minor tail protein Z (GPZ) n=1 Tax=Ferrimonas pelagia TaxID=1177826 RepID=A0ABP9ESF9_9GAMM
MATVASVGAISFKAEIDQTTRALTHTQRKSIPKATVQGLNRTIRSVRGLAAKSIATATGIKQKDVRADLSMHTASRQEPSASIRAQRRPLARNLIEHVRPNRRATSAGQGSPQFFRRRSKKRVRRGGQRRSVAGDYRWQGVEAKAWGTTKQYRGSFIINTTKGPRVVLRNGRSRKKLTLVSGPSVKATLVQNHINKAMREHANQCFRVEFRRALNNDLRRKGLA